MSISAFPSNMSVSELQPIRQQDDSITDSRPKKRIRIISGSVSLVKVVATTTYSILRTTASASRSLAGKAVTFLHNTESDQPQSQRHNRTLTEASEVREFNAEETARRENSALLERTSTPDGFLSKGYHPSANNVENRLSRCQGQPKPSESKSNRRYTSGVEGTRQDMSSKVLGIYQVRELTSITDL